jgi:C4-dicarboxylate transporter DctM subunit
MAISGLKLSQIARVIMPFIAIMLVVLMLVTYVPEFALALQPK